jgi:hypothetical protein
MVTLESGLRDPLIYSQNIIERMFRTY